MKAAGPTQGAFYVQFDFKEQVQKAAVANGQELSASRKRNYASDGDRKESFVLTAALLGGAVLARAVEDPRLSDKILESVRNKPG
jgi:hypothetical protein